MTTPTPAPSGAKASVQRWSLSLGHTIDGVQIFNVRDTSGDWVRYEDHAAHVAAKDRQIEALMEARKAWNRVGAWSVMGAPGAQTCRDEAKSADAACRALGLEIE